MRLLDTQKLAAGAIIRNPTRTAMLLLATAIGVGAVLLLTSLGEGARRYITDEFQSLGTNLLLVFPGKSDVGGAGAIAGAIGGAPRDLTLDDTVAISRSRYVARIAPVVPGSATVSFGSLERDINVMGTSFAMADIAHYELESGQFLPEMDLDRTATVCVLGHVVAEELFRSEPALGQWVRVGDRRFRVIGVMRDTGRAGGIDVDEAVFLPVASAQQLFNTQAVFRIMVEAKSDELMAVAKRDLIAIVKARHQGEEDITVVTQDAVMATFDTIFTAINAVLAGIASISLAVAGTLIMNVMLVAVSQRTEEIGLFKALGATRAQIMGLFLTEAALLSLLGALVGLGAGLAAVEGLRQLYPGIDFQPPDWAVGAAVGIALVSGIVFGILPARRAANLDPVTALAGR